MINTLIKRIIGVVHEVASDSNSDGSFTDQEDDDNEEKEAPLDEDGKEGKMDSSKRSGSSEEIGCSKKVSLRSDQVQVLWMDDTRPIQHTNKVIVINRGFSHGDFVASASEPTAQWGFVQNVSIYVDLVAPDGSIVKDVSPKHLKRVREFGIGDYVICNPWLGRVVYVSDSVTMLIDDGSICKVVGADPVCLKPVSKSRFHGDGNCPHYPGGMYSSSVLKNSQWLSGFWEANRLEGTVISVTCGSVFIRWIASAGFGLDSSIAPAEEKHPQNLKLLSCFSQANW